MHHIWCWLYSILLINIELFECPLMVHMIYMWDMIPYLTYWDYIIREPILIRTPVLSWYCPKLRRSPIVSDTILFGCFFIIRTLNYYVMRDVYPMQQFNVNSIDMAIFWPMNLLNHVLSSWDISPVPTHCLDKKITYLATK